MRESQQVVIEVEMLAFGGGAIRKVRIPHDEFVPLAPLAQMDLVFRYGQNDFQPQPMPSVSVGDVIRYQGRRYRVAPIGFECLPEAIVEDGDLSRRSA